MKEQTALVSLNGYFFKHIHYPLNGSTIGLRIPLQFRRNLVLDKRAARDFQGYLNQKVDPASALLLPLPSKKAYRIFAPSVSTDYKAFPAVRLNQPPGILYPLVLCQIFARLKVECSTRIASQAMGNRTPNSRFLPIRSYRIPLHTMHGTAG
ncbi:hypothetical protein D3C73_903960 [compost metagenome]